MPTYSIRAAHRDTGTAVTLTLEADSANDAGRIANSQGFFVQTIDALDDTPQRHPLDSEDLRYHIRDIARMVIVDGRFKYQLRRIITRAAVEAMLIVLLILFVLLPLLVVLGAQLLGLLSKLKS